MNINQVLMCTWLMLVFMIIVVGSTIVLGTTPTPALAAQPDDVHEIAVQLRALVRATEKCW